MDAVGSTGDVVSPFSGESKSALLPIKQTCYREVLQTYRMFESCGGPLMA
jgi:hypothetical protein